jgi:hypothetical protein
VRYPIAYDLERIGAMPRYHFGIHNDTETKNLGLYSLIDDPAALVFGNRVIRDVMRTNPDRYAAWSMVIAEDMRTVARIPFETPKLFA